MKELKSSLDTIPKTASELITGIEGALRELQLNREMEQEKSLEPVNDSDVIVKVTGSMESEYEIDKITNMTAEQVK